MRMLVLVLLLWVGACNAQPAAALEQRLGAPVPLDLAVRDDLGQPAHLSDFFRPREPVLLVLGYYRCPELCGLVMQGLLQGLHGSGVPATQWRIVGLSIDPQDTPADAHQRRELDLAYERFLRDAKDDGTKPRLDLLVAAPADVQRVASAMGFTWRPQAGTYQHPATVALLTPDGTIARYFNGIGIAPAELRDALAGAQQGRIGTWTDRLALLCAHFAPSTGAHTATVLAVMRGMALLTMAALAALAWRQAKKRDA